ncbi:MAG: hypothetical protein MUP30_06345 [Deltaproteobacteria bacterium]|nr:hypothetical protein [Deltaproteobacteria bacterium]
MKTCPIRLRPGVELRLGRGNMIGLPVKHLLWKLYNGALLILPEVTEWEDAYDIFIQLQYHEL